MNTSMKKIAAFKRIAAIENVRKVFTKEMKRTPFPEMYLKVEEMFNELENAEVKVLTAVE